MKKILSLFIFISCLTTLLFAQTSIGFKNPKDMEPLLSYLLPTWGYSTIVISADGKLNSNEDKNINNYSLSQFNSNLSFSPKMFVYSESEKNIRRYHIYFTSVLSYGRNKSNPSSQDDMNYKNILLSLYLHGNWNHYLSENIFFLVNGHSNIRYLEMINKYLNGNDENKRIDRS